MLGAIMLMAQALPTAPPPPRTVGPLLPQVSSVTASCAPSDDGDIVICGKIDPDQYRVRPLGPPPGGPDRPVRAGIDLPGGGRAAVTTQQVDVGGFPSKRLMIGAKLPF